jgi:trigger factor
MTNVHVEDISDVKKKVRIEVPRDKYAASLDEQYKELRKNAVIKGFRKGKAPMDLLRARFKNEVEVEASRSVIEETFEPALKDNNLVAVSVNKLEPEALEEDKPFVYTAEIEVQPEIEPHDYTGLELTRHTREVSEEEVDRTLEQMRESQSTLKPVSEDRGITSGDHLVVDIRAELDGTTVPALTVSDYHMEFGRDFFLQGFDEKIEGMTVGENKRISVTMPEDFPKKEIAGKTLEMDVTIKEAREKVLPELDDDFAKDIGEHETLEELKEAIRKDIQRTNENETRKEMEAQIVDALIEKNPFSVPESMIEKQADDQLMNTRMTLARYGINPDDLGPPSESQRQKARESSEKTIKGSIIFQGIAKKENMEVSDEDLASEIEQRAEEMGWSAEYLREHLEEHNMIEDFKLGLLQKKVIDFLIDKGEVTEEQAETPEEEQS